MSAVPFPADEPTAANLATHFAAESFHADAVFDRLNPDEQHANALYARNCFGLAFLLLALPSDRADRVAAELAELWDPVAAAAVRTEIAADWLMGAGVDLDALDPNRR